METRLKAAGKYLNFLHLIFYWTKQK
jgi:hypothetical protein